MSLAPLLRIATWIDALNGAVGRMVYWLVLAAVLISAGNAGARYGFNAGSNAWLEVQWYLFSAIFRSGAKRSPRGAGGQADDYRRRPRGAAC